MKKTILLKESELVELIESTVNDIQEQDLGLDIADSIIQTKEWGKKCDACKNKALRLARKIVAMDFEGWTEADTEFYYENERTLCCSVILYGMPGMIEHVEDGEPGWCDDWWHCILPVAAVGALFLSGPLGWWGAFGLSLGIESIDAALYYNEGNEEMAGLVLGLAVLPGVGKVVKKFPFLKQWGKAGSKTQLKLINGESVSVLEYYQLKALEANKTWIEKEVKEHFLEIAAKEQIDFAGKKITRETMEEAMKKGYLEVTVDGVTRQVSKETVEGLTKSGLYTAKQQSNLIKFGKAAVPYIIAGTAYLKIYDEMAKLGIMGPKDLIEKKWGLDPDERPAEAIVSTFFMKLKHPELRDIEIPNQTYWNVIKTLFHSSGSHKDGELMVQAIRNGWNPLQLEGHGDYTIVPKKYRTRLYNEWVDSIVNNEELIKAFKSDGSEEDNNLLLRLILEQGEWDPENSPVPEEYRTATFKEYYKGLKDKEEEDAEKLDDYEWGY